MVPIMVTITAVGSVETSFISLFSTNLSLNDLYNRYDERILSWLFGNFTICKFIGEDIRLKKKKIK